MGPSDARQILEASLARLRSGEGVDVEALCREHPDLASELRALAADRRADDGGRAALAGRGSMSFFGHQRQDPPEPPPGVGAGHVLGDFRLRKLIGRGGMGQVWEAEQLTLRRRVALKLVRPDMVTQQTLDLFAREARAGGRLHHPGIVGVHAHGKTAGVAWIAMEYIEGSWTLRDFLDVVARREDVPATCYRDVARFLTKLADALHAAHAAGVIHRDVKPQNVLITPEDEPKVTDFGLARITDETALSVTGDFAGTYYYMSPEQVAGRRTGVDHRTDVFSLGVVLYEMLALRRPFEGDTSHQVARQILFQDPPALRSLRSRIPRDLAVICGKCLEKDRERRYATMAELAGDLRRHLSNEPILAKPPGRLRKVQLWALRNPTKSVAGGVAALAFVAISVLLAENLRANQRLEQQRSDLQRLTESLETERANLAAENASVKRLSALQDYDEQVAKVDGLWPPHPLNIDEYREWIRDTQALVEELPLHRAKRDELRSTALPQSTEEREAERRSHADFARLEALAGAIGAKRAALGQRRDGVAVELPALEWDALPSEGSALNGLAWELVKPDRATYGREAEGLVLARRALEVAEAALEDELVATVGNTLAGALFALGRDEEALEASRTALSVAPEDGRAEHAGHLARLEGWVEMARGEEGFGAAEEELSRLEAEREELEARLSVRRDWEFADTEAGRAAMWWQESLTKLIEALERLQDPSTGLLSEAADAASAEHGWSVPRRLRFAERLRAGTAAGGEWDERWEGARAAIRTDPRYGGLELASQMGLVPIGRDPESGLWEFWHVATGAEPARAENGKLVLTEEMGLVLVLIPGGTFWMGAQSTNPRGRNYDTHAEADEGPAHEVRLSWYFLSKYEMTQGQWMRFTERNPSYYQLPGGRAPNLLHPVEQVSWIDCMRELGRMGLVLPSEAQWENGCRGETETPWWTGVERESLRERNAVNLADQAAQRAGAPWPDIKDWPELDDGHAFHSPVGIHAGNALGLHEVHGNVWEWCLDGYDSGFHGRGPKIDPVARWEGAADRVYRGGGFAAPAANARSAYRYTSPPSIAVGDLGIRPARVVSE